MNPTARRLVVLLASAAALVAAPAAAQDEGVAGITRPSELRHLAFVRPGIVAEVPVKEGDSVQVGELLIRQDDAAEQVQLKMLSVMAADTTRREFAEAELAKTAVELEMVQAAFDKQVATRMELLQAQSEHRLKSASLTLTRLEQQKAQADFEEMSVRVAQMRILSPIAGTLEVIKKRAGEAADGQEGVVAVVAIDPLWVDARVKLTETHGLALGAAAEVRFREPAGDGVPPIQGRIIFMSSVAEGGELLVRMEVPNPTRRPAGEHVRVNFPAERR